MAVCVLLASAAAGPQAAAQVTNPRADSSRLLRDLRQHAETLPMAEPAASQARQIVARLGAATTPEQRAAQAQRLVREVGRATRRDMPVVRAAIADLRRQPTALEALLGAFRATPGSAFSSRLLALHLIGALQDPRSLAPLQAIANAPLPPRDTGSAERMSVRERESMIQSAAIEAIGYIRTPSGDLHRDAMRAVSEAALRHASHSVRVVAIDTYMWSHGDSPAAATELRGLLPPDYHRYIDRARFSGGANPSDFEARMRQWRTRWAP